MIKWREAYERVKSTPEFIRYFGSALPMGAFRYLAYSQQFTGVAGQATAGTTATQSGPTNVNFPAGAIILGVTAAGFQAQQSEGTADYSPSQSEGRRDLFALAFQYSGGEQITPNGLTLAEALLGSGLDTIFPAKELMIPPSQSILCTVAAIYASTLPVIAVHVVYHAMVPRAAG